MQLFMQDTEYLLFCGFLSQKLKLKAANKFSMINVIKIYKYCENGRYKIIQQYVQSKELSGENVFSLFHI